MSEIDLFAAAGDGLSRDHFGITDSGTPYVVASKLAKALGYRDAANATRLLDDDEKGTQIVSTPGGNQQTSVIYEDGIWELIFRSTLPSAKSIKSKVKSILRELRENGVVDTRSPESMTEIERARQNLETQQKYVALLEQAERDKPKVEAYDSFMTSEGDYSINAVAKMLGTGQNRLFAKLREENILITGGSRHNTPYQQYMRHFRVVATEVKSGETTRVRHVTYVKPSGVDFIRKVLKFQDA